MIVKRSGGGNLRELSVMGRGTACLYGGWNRTREPGIIFLVFMAILYSIECCVPFTECCPDPRVRSVCVGVCVSETERERETPCKLILTVISGPVSVLLSRETE